MNDDQARRISTMLGRPLAEAEAILDMMARSIGRPLDGLTPAEFAGQVVIAAHKVDHGVAPGPMPDPLPRRAETLLKFLDAIASTPANSARRAMLANRAAEIEADLFDEVGPGVVLIRDGRALVPLAGLNPHSGGGYESLRCRDLDVEEFEADERPASILEELLGSFRIEAELVPTPLDFDPSPGAEATRLRRVPRAILRSVEEKLDLARIAPRDGLADLHEVEAGLICRLALVGLRAALDARPDPCRGR